MVQRNGFWTLAIGLGLLRWILGSGIPIFAIQRSMHDDALFLSLAQQIASGNWLGPYDRLTLAKGPFYPMWLAATARLGLPLIASQQILYVLACTAFVYAVAPVMRDRWLRLALLGALLFQPASFAGGFVNRVVREGIYPALTLLTVAAAAGTVLRARRSATALGGGVLSGASLGVLWITREEGPWILPAVAALAFIPWWRARGITLRTWTIAVASAVITFGAVWGSVAAVNSSQYGVFLTNDFSSGAFPRMYGALTRVQHAQWRRYVPLPRETRARIYAISPAFSELAPFLEGEPLRGWIVDGSCGHLGICDDFGGGWFLWALRDATELAGHTANGVDAARYWDRVAAEVNDACEAGKLRCGNRRASTVEPWRWEYTGPVAAKWAEALWLTVWYPGFHAHSSGSPYDSRIRGPYDLLAGQAIARGPRSEGRRVAALELVAIVYPPIQLAISAAALLGFVLLAARALRAARAPADAWWIAGAVLASILVRAGLLAILDVTSFPAIDPLYVTPAYPLVIAFAGLVAAAWLTPTPADSPPPAAL